MSIFDGNMSIEAVCASGIEAVLKREISALGYSVGGANYGRIRFEGDFLDVVRANVFLRTASRIRIVVCEFDALTFDELYDKTTAYKWESVIPRDAKFTIDAKSLKSALFALSTVQSIVKKAIATRLINAYKTENLQETGTEYNFEVNIIEDNVTISLDTSGEGLHKRGYRTYLGEAPIRETLAAAMIELSVWKPDRPFIDPFCGSGTIPIEAALIGLNIASGMNRNFRCQEFSNAPNVRPQIQKEAEELIVRDRVLRISGFDINPDAIKIALLHAERAGVRDKIHLQVGDMRNVSSRFQHGVIVTNPPYGERLMTEPELKTLYRDFGKMFA
ncbi:MAG: class I SAM-dependent RNA methyltransferase, partial [Clostridia bacterium]